MEIALTILLLACIAWVVINIRKNALELKIATLDAAWNVVLDDPNYEERRALEERKHSAKEQAQALEDDARALVKGKES